MRRITNDQIFTLDTDAMIFYLSLEELESFFAPPEDAAASVSKEYQCLSVISFTQFKLSGKGILYALYCFGKISISLYFPGC